MADPRILQIPLNDCKIIHNLIKIICSVTASQTFNDIPYEVTSVFVVTKDCVEYNTGKRKNSIVASRNSCRKTQLKLDLKSQWNIFKDDIKFHAFSERL
jgi:23S rRNA U2552 (ribose-2'-O)-methylase RlmE/FtsJ